MINIELSFVTDLIYYVIVLCLYMYYCTIRVTAAVFLVRVFLKITTSFPIIPVDSHCKDAADSPPLSLLYTVCVLFFTEKDKLV